MSHDHSLEPRHPGRRALLASAAALGLLLASGCATPRRPTDESGTDTWSGRLSLLVRSEPVQSFSAGFELRGHAQQGELQLNTPLGTTLAQARWMPGQAWLESGGQRQRFASMEALLQDVTGAALPLAALFDWLRGVPTPVDGWEAELSERTEGRLSARRLSPLPPVELRLRLDP